jgi:hypothetical protein|tara:strand:+ start:3328 stop:3906 length:579 start_codon:yes stop_codon:yes gene_type:complete
LKDLFKNIQTLLVVALAALLLYQRGCSSTPPVEPEIITEVITRWDTLKVATKEYVPKYIRKTVVEIDTFQVPIDTMSILRDYYAKYFYTDTIKVDSLGFIVINDTVTRNLISKRDVQSNIFIPTTTINNTIYLYKRELFGGISVGSTPAAIQNLSGELLFVNKKRQAYGFGLGLNNNFDPIYTARLYWKIGK